MSVIALHCPCYGSTNSIVVKTNWFFHHVFSFLFCRAEEEEGSEEEEEEEEEVAAKPAKRQRKVKKWKVRDITCYFAWCNKNAVLRCNFNSFNRNVWRMLTLMLCDSTLCYDNRTQANPSGPWVPSSFSRRLTAAELRRRTQVPPLEIS